MIRRDGAVICYTTGGAGESTLVLLHGYLENRLIFSELAECLGVFTRVICVDLPGHGLSELPSEPLSMASMAKAVREVLLVEGVERAVVAGHSMGGYVAFAFLEGYPEMVVGYSLLHSTPFADSPEKQVMRDREIALVRAGKQELLFSTNVPNGFASDSLQSLKKAVDKAVSVAVQTPAEGIVAALEALKQRPDRRELMQNSGKPLLVVLGRHDNYIPFSTMKAVALTTPCTTLAVLEQSGHNGFLEEPDEVVRIYRTFLRNLGYSL